MSKHARSAAFALALAAASSAVPIPPPPAAAQTAPVPQPAGAPAFKITGSDGGVSLLFGTLAITDARLLQPAMSVLDGARRVVVEAEPPRRTESFAELAERFDPAAVADVQRTGKLGRAGWASRLTDEDLRLLAQYAACGAQGSKEQVQAMFDVLLASKAWRAAFAVLQPCPQANISPRHELLAARARATGIPVVALEPPDAGPLQQERLASALGDDVYVGILRSALRPSGRQAFDGYVRALNAGDFDEARRISRGFFPGPTAADAADRTMVRERNAVWLPGLERALRGGGAVVMVGAGNLPGPGGLLDLLRRDGYRVEPVLVPAAPPRH